MKRPEKLLKGGYFLSRFKTCTGHTNLALMNEKFPGGQMHRQMYYRSTPASDQYLQRMIGSKSVECVQSTVFVF